MRIQPLKHCTQVLHDPEHSIANQAKRRRRLPPRLALHRLLHMLIREHIPRQRQAPVPILRRVQKRLRREIANVADGDTLQRLPLQVRVPRGHDEPPDKVPGDVVEEEDRPQHRPGHLGTMRLLEEMMLDAVLADEVRDVGRVVGGYVPAAVDRGVHEVLDFLGQSFVDEGLALALFFFDGLALAHG